MSKTLFALTLVFQGLVTHVDQHPHAGQTAVLPFEASHKAFLCVAENDFYVVPTPQANFIEKPKTPQEDPDCPGKWKIHLKNARMKFTKGIASTETFDSAAFDRAVPSLTALSGCTDRKDEIKTRTPVANVIAGYVDYPGGVRTVESYFPFMGKFKKTTHAWKDEQCYACKVQVSMETNANPVEISVLRTGDSSPTIFELKPAAQLLVRNSFKGGTGHYKHHYNIFKTCSTENMDVIEVKTTPCAASPHCEDASIAAKALNPKPQSGPQTEPDDSVECGQTAYP